MQFSISAAGRRAGFAAALGLAAGLPSTRLLAQALAAAAPGRPAPTADQPGKAPKPGSAKQFDALVAQYVQAGQFGGTVLVADQGKVVFQKGYGLANQEWQQPNAPDTKFRLGSLTKQFTALLVMQLVEKGQLKLDKTVADYLPDYPQPNGGKITIHQLLTHTAGIPNYTAQPDFQKRAMLEPTTPAAFVQSFGALPLEFEPGSKFKYSNSGYFLLGTIIEKVTGKTYAQVLQENILAPLGMTNTGYDLPATVLPHRAAGYVRGPGGQVTNAPYLDMTVPYAAGSLYSTVGDLLKWDQALYTDQLLPAASRAVMFKPFRDNYAYGWSVSQVKLGTDSVQQTTHGGGINGFITYIRRVPARRQVVVVLDNYSDSSPPALSQGLLNLLNGLPAAPPKPAAVAGATVAGKPDAVVPASTLASYVGTYQLAPNFSMVVTSEGPHLFGQATGQPKFELFPESPTLFYLKVVAAKVEFVKTAEGVVDQLVLHQNGKDLPGKKL